MLRQMMARVPVVVKGIMTAHGESSASGRVVTSSRA
jgi:hypothetical protein